MPPRKSNNTSRGFARRVKVLFTKSAKQFDSLRKTPDLSPYGFDKGPIRMNVFERNRRTTRPLYTAVVLVPHVRGKERRKIREDYLHLRAVQAAWNVDKKSPVIPGSALDHLQMAAADVFPGSSLPRPKQRPAKQEQIFEFIDTCDLRDPKTYVDFVDLLASRFASPRLFMLAALQINRFKLFQVNVSRLNWDELEHIRESDIHAIQRSLYHVAEFFFSMEKRPRVKFKKGLKFRGLR